MKIPMRRRERYYSYTENVKYKDIKDLKVGIIRKNNGRKFILIRISCSDGLLEWADLKQYEEYNTVVFKEA